ncbi:MAG: NAD(P)/FAD-dependent oxidoreductase, partial [Litorivicinus sp.]
GLRGQLYEDSPVSDFSFRGGYWHLTTPGAVVRAPKVILAVNGHVQSFGFYPKQLLHVFTYASMTRALTDDECDALGGEPDWGMLPADPMGTTVRRISNYLGGGARLVIRNHATLNQSLETSNADMKRAAGLQDRSFAARFPMLSGVPFEYRWGGRLCLALNSAPAFGELEPGLYSACCQNGLGTAKGMVSGMLAADMAMGDSSVASAYGARAPSRLPPEPFLSLGARVTMRVKEWRAGREL